MGRASIWYCVRKAHVGGGCKHRHRSIGAATRCAEHIGQPALVTKCWSDTARSPVTHYRVVKSVNFTKNTPYY